MKGFIGMGLLHKNLILAGIASMAMVGFLGSSSASALDGFSFFDALNNPGNSGLSSLSLINPFSLPHGDTGQIAYNTQEILFNESETGASWGYGGKGNVFVNPSSNNAPFNSQYQHVKSGETADYSIKVNSSRYDEESPVVAYKIYIATDNKIDPLKESIIVKINGAQLPANQITIEDDSVDTVFGVEKAVAIEIKWAEYSSSEQEFTTASGRTYTKTVYDVDEWLYDEDAVIEVLYSAKVAPSATGETVTLSHVNPKTIYQGQEPRYRYYNPDAVTKATAVINGDIKIVRNDPSGNPVKGARYQVEGITATEDNLTDSVYHYSEDGIQDTFVTGDDGVIIIKGVPDGDYTITEIFAPAEAGQPLEKSATKHVSFDESTWTTYASPSIIYSEGGENLDISHLTRRIDENHFAVNLLTGDHMYAQYMEEYGMYVSETGHGFKKTENGYDIYIYNQNTETLDYLKPAIYDERTGEYMLGMTVGEMLANSSDDELSNAYSLTFNDDGTADIKVRLNYDIATTLNEDQNTGNYYGTIDYRGDAIDASLLKTSDGWLFSMALDGEEPTTAYEFNYDEEQGKYRFNPMAAYMYIGEPDENGIMETPVYWSATYYPEIDGCFMTYGGGNTVLQYPLSYVITNKNAFVREFQFTSKEQLKPENVANPQTADSALKAIIAAAIGFTPIFILRKQLTKRAN